MLGGLVGLSAPVSTIVFPGSNAMFLIYNPIAFIMAYASVFLCNTESCASGVAGTTMFIGWILGGIIIFFLFERLLKLLLSKTGDSLCK